MMESIITTLIEWKEEGGINFRLFLYIGNNRLFFSFPPLHFSLFTSSLLPFPHFFPLLSLLPLCVVSWTTQLIYYMKLWDWGESFSLIYFLSYFYSLYPKCQSICVDITSLFLSGSWIINDVEIVEGEKRREKNSKWGRKIIFNEFFWNFTQSWENSYEKCFKFLINVENITCFVYFKDSELSWFKWLWSYCEFIGNLLKIYQNNNRIELLNVFLDFSRFF